VSVLAGPLPAADTLMSHVSINFDRAGFQRDLNVVYPMDRMRELAPEGVIAFCRDKTMRSNQAAQMAKAQKARA
jgi:D-proline reductase (dithiol) PrdB